MPNFYCITKSTATFLQLQERERKDTTDLQLHKGKPTDVADIWNLSQMQWVLHLILKGEACGKFIRKASAFTL